MALRSRKSLNFRRDTSLALDARTSGLLVFVSLSLTEGCGDRFEL